MSAKKLEILGMALILFSSFVQIFILSQSQELTTGAIQYKIERKIDIIYSITRSNYQKLHPEVMEPIFHCDPKILSDYEYAEQNEGYKSCKWQTDILSKIVGIFFILGSLILLVAKYREV